MPSSARFPVGTEANRPKRRIWPYVHKPATMIVEILTRIPVLSLLVCLEVEGTDCSSIKRFACLSQHPVLR